MNTVEPTTVWICSADNCDEYVDEYVTSGMPIRWWHFSVFESGRDSISQHVEAFFCSRRCLRRYMRRWLTGIPDEAESDNG